jgi:hypothetical protein
VLTEDMLYSMQGGPILMQMCFLEIDIHALRDWEKLFENMEIMEFAVSLNETSQNSVSYHVFLGV